MAFICLCAMGASAEIRYQSLNNIKGTNIVLVDKEAPQKVEVTDAVLINNGQEYQAKNIRCDVVNGIATYTLKFKRLTLFKDTKVILTVNGKKVMVDIKKNLSNR